MTSHIVYTPEKQHTCALPDENTLRIGTVVQCDDCGQGYCATLDPHLFGRDWVRISNWKIKSLLKQANKARQKVSNAEEWFVHSEDGMNYKVGRWLDGEWIRGTEQDAETSLRLLDEPGAYIWKRVWTAADGD